MAANNYFGFTHGGTQYATATGYQPAPQPTAGYAVPPATYTTPRAAATAYDVASYQTAAATQSAYAKAAYNSAAYDTRQNAYAQQTYPTQPQYAPYQAVTTYTTGVVPKKQCQANAAAYATSSAMQQKVTYPIQSTTVTPNQATTNKAPAVPGYEAVYSNTNFPTQNQNQVRPNNVQKRQNWFKKLKSTTGFAGAAKGSSNRLGFTNRSQEIHYCDVCRISCAGTQTYKEHLDGQKHKKREANSKLTPTTVGKPSSNPATKVFHCDLCDISCTGADSYAAHLRGSKHQKVYNLHTKLGKPIPPPCFETAAVPKVAATPKVNFVPSGKLGTVAPKVEPNISPVVTIKTSESKTLPPAVTTISTGETDVLLVGMEYIEEIKDDTGKMVSFNCKLCECKFNDPNAKEMHMKGRRHRLSYKKKVDPSLVVELKPSWFEARRMQKDKQHDGSRLRDDRSNFWSDRFMDMEDRYSWDDRRRYQEEVEYYDWCRTMGPRNMGMGPPGLFGPPAMIGGVRPPPPHLLKFAHGMRPQMHNSMRRYDTVDDKHIMAKHSSLFPKQNSLKTLQKAISDTEKALKLAAEDLVKIVPEVVLTDPETQVTETNEINNDQAKKTAKEDGRDGSMFTFTTEKDDTKVTKIMTGSMRVGALSKGLLLINENEVDLIIICSVPPTVALLNSIVMVLPDKLKIVAKDDTYIVNKHEADAKLTVETNVEDEKFIVNVTLTSPSVREAILVTAEGENQQTEPVAIVPGEHVLDKTKCLEALAAIRHAKWFQARLAIIPNGPLIIRILKDFIIREPKWHPLTPWMLELLVERVLTSTYAANSPNAAAGLTPAESLRRFFEAVASGALLPGIVGVHLIDPCEKEPVDALAPLTLQQRESITVSAQNALRLITFRQVNKVLGMEMLPIKQQRFTRKRRREGSTGEGNETEDAGENKKKDKKEDDSVNQSQANDVTDNGDGMSNGLVANVETEKIDIK